MKRTSSGNASLLTSAINLLKNCVGAGVFSLNSRVSAISSSPSDLIYVAGLVFIMAMWAAYNFYIVGETCRLSDSETLGEVIDHAFCKFISHIVYCIFSQAWSKTVSPSSVWIIQTVLTIAPIIGSLANTIVLTDILTLTLRVLGFPAAIYANRQIVLTLLISFILFPICSIKDLSGLKSTSAIGMKLKIEKKKFQILEPLLHFRRTWRTICSNACSVFSIERQVIFADGKVLLHFCAGNQQ